MQEYPSPKMKISKADKHSGWNPRLFSLRKLLNATKKPRNDAWLSVFRSCYKALHCPDSVGQTRQFPPHCVPMHYSNLCATGELRLRRFERRHRRIFISSDNRTFDHFYESAYARAPRPVSPVAPSITSNSFHSRLMSCHSD